ncbi:MAG TPA: hypothetical protein VE821_12435, partial [Pyrinomonadaceae bacterium]|nr:hypothetical protein [Pyrinomonadaceae bacterium]
MAVLKKIRSRLFAARMPEQLDGAPTRPPVKLAPEAQTRETPYDIRPLTISQLDECWRLDQRCFVDGEAYSRETF